MEALVRALFLHHNFPGQFKDAVDASLSAGEDVRFVCDTQYKASQSGVQVYSTISHSPGKQVPTNLSMRPEDVARRFYSILQRFLSQEWLPDIIYSHSGWGCGFYARAVFPSANIIAFAEWWHTSNLIDPASGFPLKETQDSLSHIASAVNRNSFQALELLEASSIVTPTYWQKSQYPVTIQDKMVVIHEGVDTDFFSPKSTSELPPIDLLNQKRILITYTSRGLEPLRCFPEFVKSLPAILSLKDSINVAIAGSDTIHYHGSPPEGYPNFRLWAIDYLKRSLCKKDFGRIKFLGTLPLKQYRNLLRLSDIHIYYTRPFVASWSLLEAMSTGCLVISGRTTNSMELLGGCGLTFDPTNSADLAAAVKSAIEMDRKDYTAKCLSARLRVCQSYDRKLSRALYQCL